MAVNRETPAALQFERPLPCLGRPAHAQCRFFLSGSQSLKRFLGIKGLFNGSLTVLARSAMELLRPLAAGEVRGGAV